MISKENIINNKAAVFVIILMAFTVMSVGLFAPESAEAHFGQYSGNPCTNCHTPEAGGTFWVAVDGVNESPGTGDMIIDVAPDQQIEIDYYYTGARGANDDAQNPMFQVPDNTWIVTTGTDNTVPALPAWSTTWNLINTNNLGVLIPFDPPEEHGYTIDYDTTLFEAQAGRGISQDDGTEPDGTADLHGVDFRVTVPSGASGPYTIILRGIGHTGNPRSSKWVELTVNVGAAGPATTTVTDGTEPGSANICAGDLDQPVNTFTLNETSGNTSSTVSAVQVTFNDYTDVSTVYIKSNDGLTTYGSITPTANVQNIPLSVLNITVNASSSTPYRIYADTAGGATGTLTATVSDITVTDTKGTITDPASSTLTFDTTAPALITNFVAADGEDSQVSLTWTNPADSDLAEVVVMRTTGVYPTDHTDGTQVYQNLSPVSSGAESPVDTTGPPTNGTTYYYAVFTRDTCGNWNDTVTPAQSADTGTPSAAPQPTTTVTDGTDPGNATICAGDTNQPVNAFNLNETSGIGSSTVSAVQVTFNDFNDVATVYIKSDDGLTTYGSGAPTGNVFNVPLGPNITVNSSSTTQYKIYIDADAGASGTLTATVSDITVTGTKGTITDPASSTITFDTTAPALITNFAAADGQDSQVSLTWTNPADSDLAEVVVMRTTGVYPTDHTDGTQVYQNLSPASSGAESPVDTNGPPANGTTYYYAVFTRDNCGNWNDTQTAGQNSDTGTPSAAPQPTTTVTEGTDPGSANVCAGDLNQPIDAFNLNETSGVGSSTVSAVQVTFNDFNDVATVYVKSDDGLTTYGSGAPTGNVYNITLGPNITVNASSTTQYKIYVDTNGAASGSVTATVSDITVTDLKGSITDPSSATLTFDTTAPALITDFVAADSENSQVSLSWTNPVASDIAEVVVMRTTGGYPTDHTNGTQVYQNLSPSSGGAESPVDTNGPPTNGTTYYYAVFTRDNCGNWDDTVTGGQNADTGTPEAQVAPDITGGTLIQYESDGSTPITAGTFTADTTLVMKGTVTDPNGGDTITLDVEIVTVGGAGFTGTPNCASGAPVTTGQVAEATCNLTVIFGTADEQYKWRARGDDGTLTGAWEDYPN